MRKKEILSGGSLRVAIALLTAERGNADRECLEVLARLAGTDAKKARRALRTYKRISNDAAKEARGTLERYGANEQIQKTIERVLAAATQALCRSAFGGGEDSLLRVVASLVAELFGLATVCVLRSLAAGRCDRGDETWPVRFRRSFIAWWRRS